MDEKASNNEHFRSLLDRARRYCAAAERCEDAVRQKLVAWGASLVESNGVVQCLFDEGYLDEERYVRAYCEAKILQQHWGRQKVIYQLRLKHLPRTAVDNGMASIGEEAYMAVLSEVAQKKLRELSPSSDPSSLDDFQLRQKLSAFLASRGFLINEINQVLTNLSHQ